MTDQPDSFSVSALRRRFPKPWVAGSIPAAGANPNGGEIRRLATLLGTVTTDGWNAARHVALLLDPERLRDLDDPSVAYTDDDDYRTLTIRWTRTEGEWSLGVCVTISVHYERELEDTWSQCVDELAHGVWSTKLIADCVLSEGEQDYLGSLVEEARSSFGARRRGELSSWHAEQVER